MSCVSKYSEQQCERHHGRADEIRGIKRMILLLRAAEERVASDVADLAQLRALETQRLELDAKLLGVPREWPGGPMRLTRGPFPHEWGAFIKDLPPFAIDLLAEGDEAFITTKAGATFRKIIAAVPSRDAKRGEWAVVRTRDEPLGAAECAIEQHSDLGAVFEDLVRKHTTKIG